MTTPPAINASRRAFLGQTAGLSLLPGGDFPAVTSTSGSINEAREARLAMRRGEWRGPTVGKVPGLVQTNLVVLAGPRLRLPPLLPQEPPGLPAP